LLGWMSGERVSNT